MFKEYVEYLSCSSSTVDCLPLGAEAGNGSHCPTPVDISTDIKNDPELCDLWQQRANLETEIGVLNAVTRIVQQRTTPEDTNKEETPPSDIDYATIPRLTEYCEKYKSAYEKTVKYMLEAFYNQYTSTIELAILNGELERLQAEHQQRLGKLRPIHKTKQKLLEDQECRKKKLIESAYSLNTIAKNLVRYLSLKIIQERETSDPDLK